jgi:hypothetical protein
VEKDLVAHAGITQNSIPTKKRGFAKRSTPPATYCLTAGATHPQHPRRENFEAPDYF